MGAWILQAQQEKRGKDKPRKNWERKYKVKKLERVWIEGEMVKLTCYKCTVCVRTKEITMWFLCASCFIL